MRMKRRKLRAPAAPRRIVVEASDWREIEPAALLWMLQQMILIRRFENTLLELKGKLAETAATAGAQQASDVVHALVALGYSDKEALAAAKGLAPGIPVAEAIRAALKALAKS